MNIPFALFEFDNELAFLSTMKDLTDKFSSLAALHLPGNLCLVPRNNSKGKILWSKRDFHLDLPILKDSISGPHKVFFSEHIPRPTPFLEGNNSPCSVAKIRHNEDTWGYLICVADTPELADQILWDSHQVIQNFSQKLDIQSHGKEILRLSQKHQMEYELKVEQLMHAEQEIQKNQQLASLGGLVAGVAHEVNTPLGVSISSASLISDKSKEIEGDLNSGKISKSKLFSDIGTLGKTSELMVNTLQEASNLISSLKQISAHQSQEEKFPINIHRLINDTIQIMNHKMKTHQPQISVIGEEGYELNTLPGIWSQIITNLLSNSTMHAFEKEKFNQVEINYKQEGSQFHLQYSDNGPGMNEEQLAKTFEPFFTTKRGRGGTGLGGFIMHNLVTDKMNGSIKVANKIPHGLTFSIRVPV